MSKKLVSVNSDGNVVIKVSMDTVAHNEKRDSVSFLAFRKALPNQDTCNIGSGDDPKGIPSRNDLDS